MTTEPPTIPIDSGFAQMGEYPLTVLVCPDADGPTGLHDTLLSLAAQITQNFGFALLAPAGSDGIVRQLQAMITGFERSFSRRARVVAGWSGPLTSAVLSLGSEQQLIGPRTTGQYVAIMTAADLAFAHWTSSIMDAAATRPGCVVHCAVAEQPCEVARTDKYPVYTSVGRPKVPWGTQFDLVDFVANGPRCEPCSAFAMPVHAISSLPERVEGPSSLSDEERLWRIVSTVALLGEVVDVDEVLQLRRHETRGSDCDGPNAPSSISGAAAVDGYLRVLDGLGLLEQGSALHALLAEAGQGNEDERAGAVSGSTPAPRASTRRRGGRSLRDIKAFAKRSLRR
jgi:hypothetical protein